MDGAKNVLPDKSIAKSAKAFICLDAVCQGGKVAPPDILMESGEWKLKASLLTYLHKRSQRWESA